MVLLDAAPRAANALTTDIKLSGGAQANTRVTVDRGADALARLHGLAAEWAALETRCGDRAVFFQSHAFVSRWVAMLSQARRDKLALVCVYDDNRLVLTLPLELSDHFALIRSARPLGEPIVQYADALCEAGPQETVWVERALEAVRAELGVDLFLLRKLRGDGALATSNIVQKACFASTLAQATAFDAQTDFATLYKSINARAAKTRRRLRRRLEEVGPVTLEMHTEGEALRQALAETVKLKSEWLAERGLTSRMFSDHRSMEAFMRLSGDASDQSALPGLAVAELSVGGLTAAMEVAFLHNGRYYAFIGTLVPEFDKYSPGSIMIEEVTGWCQANGLFNYDMLAPSDDYKARFSNDEVPVGDHAIPTSFLGRTVVAPALAHGLPAAKRLYMRLPLALRRSFA